MEVVLYSLIGLFMFGNIRKLVKLFLLVKKYPTFGNTKIRLVLKRSLVNDSVTRGSFSEGGREIRLALINPTKSLMETYLHERRHSEQAFGKEYTLRNMYAQSVGVLRYMESRNISEEVLWDEYFQAPHEVDARDWASKVMKEL